MNWYVDGLKGNVCDVLCGGVFWKGARMKRRRGLVGGIL